MRNLWFLALLGACTGKEKLPDMSLLDGACHVKISTNVKDAEIFLDGISLGHGQAETNIPCGQKKVQVEASGKKNVDEYKIVTKAAALELNYKLENAHRPEDFSMSQELVDQLAKGEGPIDKRDPHAKELLAQMAKERDEEGFYFTAEELAAAAKKAAGGGPEAAAAPQFDPNTNFDDPKTWM